MKDKPSNLAASISGRLRNYARERRMDLELLLRRYALERLLVRLGASPHRDRFILKGAMLFTLWNGDPFRPTQDLDLLGFGDAAVNQVAEAFREICRQAVSKDGLEFDADDLVANVIREDTIYGGARVKTKAFLGKTRIPIQIDIGFGDAITPAPIEAAFPSLLGGEQPYLLAYPRETVVAEKFQAIVALGIANSRMKDFYDLLVLARLFAFDGAVLSTALRATFERRGTPLPAELPIGLSAAFAKDALKKEQWHSFNARDSLAIAAPDLLSSIEEILTFVWLPTQAALADDTFDMVWQPPGPWRLHTPDSP